MFFKDTEKKSAEKSDCYIGPNSDFKGELNIKGTLMIDGILNGNVSADSVVLGETAMIKGDVTAKHIIVGGRVEGNLKAKEIVEIKSKGKVFGEIFTNKFAVMEGGEFNGKIEMKMDESKVLEFESKTQEA